MYFNEHNEIHFLTLTLILIHVLWSDYTAMIMIIAHANYTITHTTVFTFAIIVQGDSVYIPCLAAASSIQFSAVKLALWSQ